MTAISKEAADRVETLLAYLNYLATLFGTSEYLFRKYGIEGVDYQETRPSSACGTRPTARGRCSCSTKACFDAMKEICPDAVANPVDGLYSETQNRMGSQLTVDIDSFTGDIIQGREPVSAWPSAVEKWKERGGDKIAEELYAAYQASR